MKTIAIDRSGWIRGHDAVATNYYGASNPMCALSMAWREDPMIQIPQYRLTEFIEVNDSIKLAEDTREQLLTDLFRTVNVDLCFIN